MILKEAINQAINNGYFITNSNFNTEQSIHYFDGNLYYQDGSIITEKELEMVEMLSSGWRIKFDKVDHEKLKMMHQEVLRDRNYNDACVL